MFKVLLLITIVTLAHAFIVTRPSPSSLVSLNVKSKALPFLEAPAKLDGTLVGDRGFDPLGLTNTINNLDYVRSAELKHARVAMLAIVGVIVQKYIHVLTPESDPFKAITALGYGPNLQILSFIGVIELATWNKTYSGDRGDLGFDPMGQMKGKNAKQIDDLKLKELKNGRLAMVAFVGIAVQILAGKGLGF